MFIPELQVMQVQNLISYIIYARAYTGATEAQFRIHSWCINAAPCNTVITVHTYTLWRPGQK